jgi:hypothetical protein
LCGESKKRGGFGKMGSRRGRGNNPYGRRRRLRQTYTRVPAPAFAGCFLLLTAWKRIRALDKGRELKKDGIPARIEG